MSTEHKNGYRQPVNFTKLVKAEFDENEKRFLLLVSDLETAEAYIEKLEQQIACGKKALAETKANELLAEGNIGSLRLQMESLANEHSRLQYQYKTAQDELDLVAGQMERENARIEYLEKEAPVEISRLEKLVAEQEKTIASMRVTTETLRREKERLNTGNGNLLREIESLKRTQLAYVDREDFVNMEISEKPLSNYGREYGNTDLWQAEKLVSDQEANWYFFSDHYQNIQRNTLKQRALIQILAAYLQRAVFDTDFKSVILAQHPVKPGEPRCESVFYNQAYLGVISVQDTKVLFYPPEQKR